MASFSLCNGAALSFSSFWEPLLVLILEPGSHLAKTPQVRGGGILLPGVSILLESTAVPCTSNFTSSELVDNNAKAGGVPEWRNEKRLGGPQTTRSAAHTSYCPVIMSCVYFGHLPKASTASLSW